MSQVTDFERLRISQDAQLEEGSNAWNGLRQVVVAVQGGGCRPGRRRGRVENEGASPHCGCHPGLQGGAHTPPTKLANKYSFLTAYVQRETLGSWQEGSTGRGPRKLENLIKSFFTGCSREADVATLLHPGAYNLQSLTFNCSLQEQMLSEDEGSSWTPLLMLVV